MLYINIAICVSILCSFVAFWLSLRAMARVANFQKSLKGLDWEAIADLTGDIASVKRSVQKVNNRFNGFDKANNSQGNALRLIEEARGTPTYNGFGASG